ncbi:hypothetical protein C1631_010040 [Chryseobacterium phosphatilyticum]|uniref:Uncharacterized protein n=1 Tax=Chryseobacterium phosphatilyticum TaxID=475075 RepID=A0A316X926_9FLAO|nr:hypothetical protein [Chryseobacterium phosphatilyticum]PWN70311.1 hypothetical protein C1631_010040 [Chryseobacterium phosphatilyticum]
MAEELYFIKTNPNIAKINLYNKLCREEENIQKFLSGNPQANLEIIKEKIKDSVEELSKEELSTLFAWFSTLYPADHEEVKTQLFINGIDLFYEIPSTNHVQPFLQVLSDYEKFSKEQLDYIVDAKNFNQFLIYGIFFTEIINKEQGRENILSDYLKSDYQTLYLLAENQCREQNFNEESGLILQRDFAELYDQTKFYKGSIIQLDQQ